MTVFGTTEETIAATLLRDHKFYALRISEVERGEYAKPAKVTISEFGQQYLEYAKANKQSWLCDEQIMKHLNGFFFGNTLLTELSPLPIERYRLERMQAAAPATVNREIALLNLDSEIDLSRMRQTSDKNGGWTTTLGTFASHEKRWLCQRMNG